MLEHLIGKIISIDELTTDVKLFKIELDKEVDFSAGQFMNFEILVGEKKLIRAYSIASSPKKSKKILEFSIKLMENGIATPILFKMKVGDKINLLGPFGLFTLDKLKIIDDEIQKKGVIFIGTGTGIAPLRSMINDLILDKKELEFNLIFGVRYVTNYIFYDEFLNLEKNNTNFTFRQVVSRPDGDYFGRRGYVQDNLDGLDLSNFTFFICGSKPMVESTEKKLLDYGVSKSDIFFEKF